MALNALESFVINTKDKLEQDFYIQSSTEEEREKIREKLNEVYNRQSKRKLLT